MSHALAESGTGKESLEAKQKVILTSLIVDFILWIPDVAAAILSGSIVLMADAVKCANEIIATFFAYITIRKMAKGGSGTYDYGMGKFETVTSLITGTVMFVSLALVFYAAIHRIRVPEELVREGVMLGVVLMLIGVAMNTYLWQKNYRLWKKEPSPIMDSQWRLFRTKAFSDFAALLSLVAGVIFAQYAWSLYIDPLFSFFIVGVLLSSGYRVIVTSLPDLLDKTLDEELQMVIVKHLAEFFHDYTALHGVRSRRSGNNVYIEIFLEFDKQKSMGEVQATINRIKASLEKSIPKSSVSIVPADTAMPQD
ncbi:MAG: cation diffusion facilitator family transporter [Methanomicrobiales archaeon]|nr:cation diffusion facilitator family transporter [Methanomicrobiales archaeon]